MEKEPFYNLCDALIAGDVNKFKYLLEGHKYLTDAVFGNRFLLIACNEGHLDIVKYLLTSPELKEYADNANKDEGFIAACQEGHLDIVKYLLMSLDLNKQANIYTNKDEGFIAACQEGHLDIVKYLLTSPDLIEHADVHANYDSGFKLACQESRLNVVEYLLEYVGHYPLYQFALKTYIKKGNIDLLTYLKSNKKEETEECEIFL